MLAQFGRSTRVLQHIKPALYVHAIFGQYLRILSFALLLNRPLIMNILATDSVWAMHCLDELLALACLECRKQVLFLSQFRFPMSKTALVAKSALPICLPIFAHLRLLGI